MEDEIVKALFESDRGPASWRSRWCLKTGARRFAHVYLNRTGYMWRKKDLLAVKAGE
jgi:hypothetical protein